MSIPADQGARVQLAMWASQLLYTRKAWSWEYVIEHGLGPLEERLRRDAMARGYPWAKLMRDAGQLMARNRRAHRGECNPREYGSGVYPPDAVPDRRRGGGYALQDVRAFVDAGEIS